MLEAKAWALRHCFPLEIMSCRHSHSHTDSLRRGFYKWCSHTSLCLAFSSRKLRKDPTLVLKALGKSCKNNTCRCGRLFSDPWCEEGHEEIMKLEDWVTAAAFQQLCLVSRIIHLYQTYLKPGKHSATWRKGQKWTFSILGWEEILELFPRCWGVEWLSKSYWQSRRTNFSTFHFCRWKKMDLPKYWDHLR
jgi:hypothetical protein